jgi:hypothetical protein
VIVSRDYFTVLLPLLHLSDQVEAQKAAIAPEPTVPLI